MLVAEMDLEILIMHLLDKLVLLTLVVVAVAVTQHSMMVDLVFA